MADIKDEFAVVGWRAWGNPYHGEIVGGTLTLPDASTRTVPATTSNACFDFHVPGAPGGGDAPVPAGGEWRDYVLLYGAGQVVYGKQVSTEAANWLYVRPDGSRWLIKLISPTSGITANGSSLTIYFTATRFGDLSGAPESGVNFNVTLTSRGMDTSGVSGLSNVPSTVSLGISDISADGQKCCLMFYHTIAGDETGGQQFPVAFAELTLHATTWSSSTITLFRDIDDVAGTRATSSYTFTDGTPSPCSDTVSNTASGGGTRSVVDSVMACWYDGTGTLVPVHYNYAQPLTSSTLTKYWPCAEYFTAVETRDAEFSLSYGAAAFGQYDLAFTHSYSKTSVVTAVGDPDDGSTTEVWSDSLMAGAAELWDVDITQNLSFSTRGVIYYDGALNSPWTGYQGLILPGPTLYQALVPAYVGNLHPWALHFSPETADHDLAASDPDVNNAPLLFAKRCSPTLIIIGRTWVDRTSLDRETRIDKAITKHGAVNIAASIPVNTTLSQISAAVHPVTGDIIIGTDGVARAFV